MTDYISRADAMSKCKNAENELTDEAERKGVRVARFIIGELPSAELPKSELISRADAIEEFREWVKRANENGETPTWNDAVSLIGSLPSADAVPQSEQYKKGFEDAKRAFELEYARESENMRKRNAQLEVMLNAQKAISADAEWIPLSHDDDGMGTDFPYERDGEWVIVTDGNTISVERIKKDAYDHFYPNGRWFELDDVIAWMPLPKPYREESEVEE